MLANVAIHNNAVVRPFLPLIADGCELANGSTEEAMKASVP